MSMQTPPVPFPHRAVLVFTTLVLLAAGALVVTTVSGARAKPAAHVTLVKGNPVTVSGRGFRPRIRVHLVLMSPGTMTRSPRATGDGTFTVTFPTKLDRCSGWSLTASQPGRTLVTLRSPAQPECAPMGAP
jgi:hypothetical protein